MPSKKFSPKRDFTKSNIQKTPADRPVVYKIEDGEGKNIYSGSAKRGRVPERLMEHLPGGPHPVKGAATF